MKKIITNGFLLLSFITFAQKKKLEDGVYIASGKEQNIRLILKDNKYDLSFTSGQFDVKKDSIIFNEYQQNKETFNVKFENNRDLTSEKIKVRLDGYDFYNIYFAAFNENATPIYKRISDIPVNEDDYTEGLVSNKRPIFEIDRSDYLVLVKEDYLYKSEMCKFKIPAETSNILIEVKDKSNDNLKLAGIFNPESNELTISKDGKNPLKFVPENQLKNKEATIAIPVEKKNIEKWNYPGKDQIEAIDAQPATDIDSKENASETNEPLKFTLNIEKNLSDALANTAKKPHKFLIIYYDPKNSSAKSSFDAIIKEQITQLNYNMYQDYDKKYDLFDFYLANKKDEKWLKNKNITTFPTVTAVNSSGEILSQSNKTLFDLQNQFYYYNDFGNNLTRANVLNNFKKAVANKLPDSETIKAFADLSALQVPYQEEVVQDAIPVVLDNAEKAAQKAAEEINKNTEIKEVPEEKEAIKVDPEVKTVETIETYLPPVREDVTPDENTYIKPVFDKNLVQTSWKNLIQTHKNDIKPNIDLAVIIIKELNGNGFTKQIFNTENIIDPTNSLALDYLFKHFNAIEKARLDSTYNVDAIHDIDLLENAIQYIINGQIKLINETTPLATQQKIITYYKRLLDIKKTSTFEKIHFNFQNDYFELLKTTAINSKSDKQFLNEYDEFHNNLFKDKTNVIETLDNLFNTEKGVEYESETWTQFKVNYANSANNAAWYVVEHSKNSESIKKAIKWSEHSLKISKNNHYYLDTLAQLYYKNGEKEKAFKTEQLAIDNNFDDANEYITTLQKMKNGSY